MQLMRSLFSPIKTLTAPSLLLLRPSSQVRHESAMDNEARLLARRFWIKFRRESTFAMFHPFSICLASGDIKIESFRSYIAQDAHFLKAFAHLHKLEKGMEDYAEFLHLDKKRFTNFAAVRNEIQVETYSVTGKSNRISNVPIHLSIYSPHVVNLTLIDLRGLTKVVVEGQPESIVQDIENMVRSYISKPNCVILVITPANQDVATSNAIKIAREVDPTGDRTFGVLTKLDLMDRGTNALDVRLLAFIFGYYISVFRSKNHKFTEYSYKPANSIVFGRLRLT